MEIDVRCVMTHAERLREERRKNVADEFARVAPVMIGEMGLSPERVMRFVADRFHLSVPGVKKYLREAGVYECNARLREQYQGSQTGFLAGRSRYRAKSDPSDISDLSGWREDRERETNKKT